MATEKPDSEGKPKVVKKAEREQRKAEALEDGQSRDEKLRDLLMRVRADLFSIIYGIEVFLDFPKEKRTSARLKNKR